MNAAAAANATRALLVTTARREFAELVMICDGCDAELDGHNSCYCAECEAEIFNGDAA